MGPHIRVVSRSIDRHRTQDITDRRRLFTAGLIFIRMGYQRQAGMDIEGYSGPISIEYEGGQNEMAACIAARDLILSKI